MTRPKSAMIVFDLSLVVIGLVTLWHLAAPNTPVARDYPSVHLGDPVRIPGMTWADAERHVVLVISTTCPWCSKSAEFYRELSKELSARRDVHLVLVHKEDPASVTRWLADKQIAATEVMQVPKLNEIGLSETPTALIVNSEGEVTDALVGMMSPQEALLFHGRCVAEPGSKALTNIPREVTRSALRAMVLGTGVQLLDIRERKDAGDRRESSLVMPIDEMTLRAPLELSKTRSVAIDCSPGWMQRCRVAARVIRPYVADVVVGRP